MRSFLMLLLCAFCAATARGADAGTRPVVRAAERAWAREAATTPVKLAPDWICSVSDNICGLRDTKMLSNPAKVDFDALLSATSELQRVRKEGIDPSSPEGVALKQAGIDRVTKACDAVRVANGHCSVWKAIKHRDERVIADITELVKARL